MPASLESVEWLYNASLVLPLTSRLTAFASATSGIEEAGTAPQNARNRFEALPPILARQSEVGVNAWTTGSSGIQSWEPVRRVMLSLVLGD